MKKGEFSEIVGAIDCTHIAIEGGLYQMRVCMWKAKSWKESRAMTTWG